MLARLHQDLAVGAGARLLDRLSHLVQGEAGGDDLAVVDGAAGHQADHVGEDPVARVALGPEELGVPDLELVQIDRHPIGGAADLGDLPVHGQDPLHLGEGEGGGARRLDALGREKELLQQYAREALLLRQLTEAELRALRAQINPHFLFNALNTIASLIPRHPDRAEKTIEQLAEVFRYTLRRSDREWVTLEEELEAVRAYLDVEQERFGDRLVVRLACTQAARSARIPAMVVQTLVENAVKHGAGAIRTQAVVEIEADISASEISIMVRDNGPGFPAAAMRSLPPGDGGYGLRNIRERLQGHFGEAASLVIDRDTALGMTVVSLLLPVAVPRAVEARAL